MGSSTLLIQSRQQHGGRQLLKASTGSSCTSCSECWSNLCERMVANRDHEIRTQRSFDTCMNECVKKRPGQQIVVKLRAGKSCR
jgi:hypothetical protein